MSSNQTPKRDLTETIPSVWPGAFNVFRASKAAVMHNLGTVLGLMGLTILVSIAGSIANPNRMTVNATTATTTSNAGMLIYLICELVSVLLSVALLYALIAGVKQQSLSVNDSLRAGWAKYLVFFGQTLLIGLITIGCILCFIVPALIIVPRLALAQYFLLEENLSITDSIRASWRATKGNVGKVWGIVGVNILIGLLCITIVGIPFAIYFGVMYQAAVTVLYFHLKQQPGFLAQANPTAPSGPVPPTV